MSLSEKLRVTVLITFAVALLLVLTSPALGQCAMCKAVLSSSNAKFIKNFNIGVLVLLAPPVSIFCAIFVVLKRHARHQSSTEEQAKSNE
ncbi:MAG: hypothetical protein ABR555_17480 [Pyrinomonadaceae bacterium]